MQQKINYQMKIKKWLLLTPKIFGNMSMWNLKGKLSEIETILVNGLKEDNNKTWSNQFNEYFIEIDSTIANNMKMWKDNCLRIRPAQTWSFHCNYQTYKGGSREIAFNYCPIALIFNIVEDFWLVLNAKFVHFLP